MAWAAATGRPEAVNSAEPASILRPCNASTTGHDQRLAALDRAELASSKTAEHAPRLVGGGVPQRPDDSRAVQRGPDELGPDLPVGVGEFLARAPDISRERGARHGPDADAQAVARRRSGPHTKQAGYGCSSGCIRSGARAPAARAC